MTWQLIYNILIIFSQFIKKTEVQSYPSYCKIFDLLTFVLWSSMLLYVDRCLKKSIWRGFNILSNSKILFCFRILWNNRKQLRQNTDNNDFVRAFMLPNHFYLNIMKKNRLQRFCRRFFEVFKLIIFQCYHQKNIVFSIQMTIVRFYFSYLIKNKFR